MKSNLVRIFSSRIALLFVTALLLAPASARAQGPIGTTGGPDVPFKGCWYYEDANFAGDRREILRGIKRPYVGNYWNDRISSIACAPGCSLRVWEDRDFRGASRMFHGNTVYVGDTWNDQISSAEPVCR